VGNPAHEQRPEPCRAARGAGDLRAALLADLAREAGGALAPLLESMFGACDDYFFDLASRAKSNQDQNLYFDSLREIRQKKGRVDRRVRRPHPYLAAGAGPTGGTPKEGEHTQTGCGDTLELIAKEQIEKDVLVTDMVTRARWMATGDLPAAGAPRRDRHPQIRRGRDALDPARIAEPSPPPARRSRSSSRS